MNSSNGSFINNGFDQDVAPSFLFGNRSNKRKAFTLGNRPSGFATGSPSILKKDLSIPGSGGKSVRWSTDLVQQQTFLDNPVGSSLHDSSNAFSGVYNFRGATPKGPPLTSLELHDFEPPQKLQRPDVNLDRKETALNAINNSFNAPNPSDVWVTVFGFAPGDRNMIVELFSRHGTIVTQKSPETGNWINLRYSSAVHAYQALKLNGHIIEDRIMIGVVKCTDKMVMETSILPGPKFKEMTFVPKESQLNGTRNSLSFADACSFNESRLSALSRNGMRSLRASEIDVSLDNSSRKDDSILSKIWNFVSQH